MFRYEESDSDETVEYSDLYDTLSAVGWLRNQCPDEVESERTAKFTLDLSGVVGARRDFDEIDFSLTNLRGANFTGSSFRSARFRRADLRYAAFHGVDAQWSNFDHALFQNTYLELAEFHSCNFEGASFAVAQFKSTMFINCHISDARFEGANDLTDEMIAKAWAWKDRPPSLPKGVKFDNFYDPGLKGELRRAYWQSQPSRRGFDPPG